MLAIAAGYFTARSEETSRRWYLIASYKAAGPVVLLGVLLWIGRHYATVLLGLGAFHIALAVVAGAMGALLSVITRSGALRFDCSAGRPLHDLEGASRICAGMLSGALLALAVESGLVLGPLLAGANRVNILLVAAFAAGTTERFAPSIISKLGADVPGNVRAEGPADTKDAS
jgi:hypothetical protein